MLTADRGGRSSGIPWLLRIHAATPALLAASIFLAACAALEPGRTPEEALSVPVEAGPAPAAPSESLREVAGSFRRNETVGTALLPHGLSGNFIHELVEKARPVYDLARVRAQQPYWLHFTESGDFRDFIYPIDDERYLTVSRHGDTLIPVMKNFSYEVRTEAVSGVIRDSLFMAVTRAGEGEQLAVDLADIFMWDIDFWTDIQRNDSFRLLVEKRYLDGDFRRYGAILAAEITVQDKTFTAFRFGDPSGKARYYSIDGKALSKSFLKSPLRFTRISSRFSLARRHPILKIVRPHLGVDYAAPHGTQVVAVASGRVAFAGSRADYGRLVHLRHSHAYETMYAHLSGIAVSAGEQVAQGDVIGYVGSSGLASGPHLDFRVLQRGKFVNPGKVVVPPDPPVTVDRMPFFLALRDGLQEQLDQARFMGVVGTK
ncbi:MAG: M23 family metallopeptidase [Acidobacteriota bacterium]